jgi:hypothetical protein
MGTTQKRLLIFFIVGLLLFLSVCYFQIPKSKSHENHIEFNIEKKNFFENIDIGGKEFDFFYSNFYKLENSKNVPFCEYSIVSQLTYPRLDRILYQARNWKQCISVALHISKQDFDSQFDNKISNVYTKLEQTFKEITTTKIYIHLHLSNVYKINTLRNFAMKHSISEYVLFLDIDWIVSKNLFEILKKFGPPKQKTVYALITFDMKCNENTGWYPNSFNCQITNYYPHGQHMTNYEKWKISDRPYKVEYNWPYEPYFVGKKSELPLANPIFDFGGNDKVSLVQEMALIDFSFFVLPNCYVSHYPHIKIEHWSTRSYEKAVELWHDYIPKLRLKYPHKEIRDHYLPWGSKCAIKTCSKEEMEMILKRKGN